MSFPTSESPEEQGTPKATKATAEKKDKTSNGTSTTKENDGNVNQINNARTKTNETFSTDSRLIATRTTVVEMNNDTNTTTSTTQTVPKQRHVTEYQSASFLSKALFLWPYPLLKLGLQRTITEDDLPEILNEETSSYNLQYIKERLLLCHSSSSRKSLHRAFVMDFLQDLWYIQVAQGCGLMARIGQAIALGLLIDYFSSSETSSSEGYLWAFILVLCGIVVLFEHHHVFMVTWRKGLQYKIACVAAIYDKSLRLSSIGGGTVRSHDKTKKSSTTTTNATPSGKIMNLASNDVERFTMATLFGSYIVWGPLYALVVLILGCIQIGPAFACGYSLLIIFVPLQFYLSHQFATLRSNIASITDARVNLVSQAVSGARVMKMSGWEYQFKRRIEELRHKESTKIQQANRLRALNEAIYFVSAIIMSVVTFCVHVALGGILTPRNVFTTMTLINVVQFELMKHFSLAVMSLSECSVSITRLDHFLSTPELPTLSSSPSKNDPNSDAIIENPSSSSSSSSSSPSTALIAMTNVTCYWDFTTSSNTNKKKQQLSKMEDNLDGSGSIVALKNIHLSLHRGELCCIIGSVGSGKSALLQAIIGELPIATGSLELKSKTTIAYASQEPFLINGTIQENITFGLEMRPQWYREVVEACGLKEDLSEQFRHGDQTIVGDRGIQCSGGQRARIGLARAIYRDSQVVVLDDPLSAVDTKVGRHIFYEAIMKLCLHRQKCVVLATHQHQFLGSSPNNNIRCILMSQGQMICDGSYKDCVQVSRDILKKPLFVQQQQQHEEEEDTINGHGENTIDPNHQAKEEEEDDSKHQSIDSNNNDDDVLPDEVQQKSSTITDTDEETIKPDDNKEDSNDNNNDDQTDDHREQRSTGIVQLSTFINYMKAMGGIWVGLGVLGLFALAQVAVLVTITMQGDWAELSPEQQSTPQMYGLILGLGLSVVILGLVRSICGFYVTIKASRQLHDSMMSSVLRAKIEFFDTNPLGRILNRFSADVGIVDDMLPQTIFDFIMCAFMVLGGIITTAVVLPFILLLFPPIIVYFVYVRRTFLLTSRELKRMEGVARSPMFALLGESLQGIATMRANSALEYFHTKFEQAQNNYCRTVWSFIASSRWLGFRMDCIMTVLLAVSSVLAVVVKEYQWLRINSSLLGLALMLIIQLSALFQWCVRQSAEVVNYMVSVERILEFTSLESEAPLETPDDSKLPSNWPHQGSIDIQNLVVRYRSTLPPSLKGVSFQIKPGERVGVVGRTGAGKSTLAQALFRLLEAQKGQIHIDGVDVSTLGLHKLRTQMSVIPQQPLLFDGCTIRQNLDPFQSYDDTQIWNALESVQMRETIQHGLPSALNSIVAEGGSNFSVGQRQLLCLARAILRQNQILILDEPTANVDRSTDKLLQKAVHDSFPTSTIIAIAHRLDTIIDYDKILVLGNGQVLEFGTPLELLSKTTNGTFASMVYDTGSSMSMELKKLAHEASAAAASKRSKVNY